MYFANYLCLFGLLVASNAVAQGENSKQVRGLAHRLVKRTHGLLRASDENVVEACEGNTAYPSCSDVNARITVTSVVYAKAAPAHGCVNSTRFLKRVSYSPTCVTSWALGIVKERCDDELSCSLDATDAMFWDFSCPDVTKHLEINYVCETPVERVVEHLMDFLAQYEAYMGTPVYELESWVTRSFMEGLLRTVLFETSPGCQEYLLSSYITGLLEYNFKFDHTITTYIRDTLAAANGIAPNSTELQSLLYAIQDNIYEPVRKSINDVTIQYQDFEPAGHMFRDLKTRFSPQRFSKWTLTDLLLEVYDVMGQWHVAAITRCEEAPSTDILRSITYGLWRATEHMDRCLVQDRLKADLAIFGLHIPDELMSSFTDTVANYMRYKTIFIWEIIWSDGDEEVIFWQIFKFFERVLSDASHGAEILSQFNFLSDHTNPDLLEKFSTVVANSNTNRGRVLFMATDELLKAITTRIDTSTVSSILGDTIERVFMTIPDQLTYYGTSSSVPSSSSSSDYGSGSLSAQQNDIETFSRFNGYSASIGTGEPAVVSTVNAHVRHLSKLLNKIQKGSSFS